ncbi:MAG: hypothetical protein V1775_12460 [Bacteroidota bacterium]
MGKIQSKFSGENEFSAKIKSTSFWADIAGVLGFILALYLGYITYQDRYDKIMPTLSLAGLNQIEKVPFSEIPKFQLDSMPGIVFTLNHEKGKTIIIQSVALKIKLEPIEKSHGASGSWSTSESFGPAGYEEYDNDNVIRYGWLIDKNGSILPPEVRSLPFSEGSTRYYAVPLYGPWSERKRFFQNSNFATLEIWSQDKKIEEFDVSQLLSSGLKEYNSFFINKFNDKAK